MQKQEQIASEEAEKRLKAALTAKREPVSASRVASPSLNHTTAPDTAADSKPRIEETSTQEDTVMEVEQNNPMASPPTPEASFSSPSSSLHTRLYHNRARGFLSLLPCMTMLRKLRQETPPTSLGEHRNQKVEELYPDLAQIGILCHFLATFYI